MTFATTRHPWVLATLLPLVAAAGEAQQARATRLTEPREKVIAVQEVVTFVSREYTPPYKLPEVEPRSAASYDSAESTLAAWVSAVAQGDEEWLAEILHRPSDPRTAEQRAQESAFFDRFFRGHRLVLTHQIQVADVVLLRMSNFDRRTGERSLTFFYAFEPEGKRWRMRKLPQDEVVETIVSSFDHTEDTLVVSRGFAVNTVRPR